MYAYGDNLNRPAYTNYGYDIDPFVAGQVTDASISQVDTVSTETEHVGFGLILCATNTKGIVTLPSLSNQNFIGAARHEHLDPAISGLGYLDPELVGFPPKYPIPLLRVGRIACPLDSDVMSINPLSPVYVRLQRTGLNIPGQIRTSNADDSEIWDKAKFTGRFIPGKLAEISIVLN